MDHARPSPPVETSQTVNDMPVTSRPHRSRRSFPRFLVGVACVVASIAVAAAGLAQGSRNVPRWLGVAILVFGLLGACLFLWDFGARVYALVKVIRAKQDRRAILVGALKTTGTLAALVFGMIASFFALFAYERGRQLRSFGRISLPALGAEGAAWSQVRIDSNVPATVRVALADAWRENGRTEHASVAAFAHHTASLVALGAPPKLIAASERDGLDEIRHAELCISLARSLDGRSIGPTEFPRAHKGPVLTLGRSVSLASLAVDSLVEGVLQEGVSARVVARMAKVCEDPAIQALLKEIAADEGKHSAHAWDVVEWCLMEGGQVVEAALCGAVLTFPERMVPSSSELALRGALESYGIPGATSVAQEFEKARADVSDRVARFLTVVQAA